MRKQFKSIEAVWQICPELKSVMTGTGQTGRSGRTLRGEDASTRNNVVAIANLVVDLEARRTLETGMACGASTLAFLAALQENTGGTGRHTAIDPFQREHYDDCGVLAAHRAGFGAMLDVQYRQSSIALAALLDQEAQFDIVYIDGSHLFEDAFVDAYFAARLLKPGGIVLFDDCKDAHLVKLMRFIKTNLGQALEVFDLRPWRAEGAVGLPYRLAQRLGRIQMMGFRKVGKPGRDYGTRLTRF